MTIAYEDNSIIIVNKEPGQSSQPDFTGDISLAERMAEYLGCDTEEVHIITRLDKPVSGLVMFAKTKEAAGFLSCQNGMEKKYLAAVYGELSGSGVLEDYLVKNARLNISKVTSKSDKNAKLAKLSYNVLETKDIGGTKLSLLDITLHTGRHHQIRVQLSHAGYPIWGDNKYGDFKNKNVRIALFCHSLAFNAYSKRAKGGKRVIVTAPMPEREPFNYF